MAAQQLLPGFAHSSADSVSNGIGAAPFSELPPGVNTVLKRQTSGFWRTLSTGRSHPEICDTEVPNNVYTFDPWIGCLWGRSCRFCYVPNLMANSYPDRRDGYWFNEWGRWLVPKPDIVHRLARTLLDARGVPKPRYEGAFVFMSPKTDPFLPMKQTLVVAREVLQVFNRSNVFLMCQTRSSAVVDDPEIFETIAKMAARGRVGVSFSISTDLEVEQRVIERGGLNSARRFSVMRRLKDEGVFVYAAVSPLMPYSAKFASQIVEVSHHASIQPLRSARMGASTPTHVLDDVDARVWRDLDLPNRLADELSDADGFGQFSWGVGNRGFIGALLASKRFYQTS